MKRTRRPFQKKRRRAKGWNSVRRLTFEPLETRQLLAVLMVNSIEDVFDPQDGLVTLREAIIAANNDSETELGDIGSGADEIQFDPDLFTSGPVSLTLSSLGHMAIASDLTISGPGEGLLTIRAFDPTPAEMNGDGSRIFDVGGLGLPIGFVVQISDLTLTGGDVSDDGGAIRLQNVDLSIENLSIVANGAAGMGGGVFVSGGMLSIANSKISGNQSGSNGGGVASNGSELTTTYSTVSDNIAGGHGGGVRADGGIFTMTGSTVSGNFANSNDNRFGGGLSLLTNATVINSTISGNTGSIGGGVFSNGSLVMTHSTVTGNSTFKGSGPGGNYFGTFGGIDVQGLFILDHTIVANNIDNETSPDLNVRSGTFAAVHNSLIGINSGSGLPGAPVGFPDANGNLVGTVIFPIDPMLTGLDNFGSPNQSHALLPGSPAIDAGDPAAIPGVNGVPLTDQRGSPRLQGPAIDMGAFEVEASSGMPPNLFSPGPQSTKEGTIFDLSQLLVFNDDGSGPYSARVDWGDGSLPEFVGASGGFIFASHVYADDGTYNVQLQLTNAFGSDVESFLIGVSNVAPNLTAVGDQLLTVGDPLNLMNLGSLSDPGFDSLPLGSFETFRYFIDWDDGSIPDTGTATIDTVGSAIQPTLASFDGSHNYAAPGTYTVAVRMADDDMSGDFVTGVVGIDYVERTFMVMVDGLPPELFVPSPQSANEAATFDLSQFVFFTDNGFGPYSAIVNWGDGSAPENALASDGKITASHVYADDGDYTIEIQLDNAFGSDSADFQVTVNNVAPNLVVVGNQLFTVGDTLNLTNLGGISDPGFDNQNLSSFESFSYFIDWDDGSAPDTGTATIDTSGSVIQPTLASFDGSHNYAAPGTYTVTVRVADDDMSGDFTSGVAGVDYVERTFVVMVAESASLVVTTAEDLVDAFDGETSLREALDFADGTPGAAVITFAPQLNGGTIVLMMGELSIIDSVAIDASSLASGITIDASGNDPTPNQKLGDGTRVFQIDDGDDTFDILVSFKNLTITGGDTAGDGGGILSRENLTISDSLIRNNRGDRGGGIFSEEGAITVERTILRDNMADRWGGAMFVENSALMLSDSALMGNMANTFGGGIDVLSSDTVVILRSTISGNQLTSPSGSGGGIYARTPDGLITITHSTISGNTGGRGGGIHGETSSGTIEITNSTISGNSAAEDGGGIYLLSDGTAILAQNTITQNTSDSDNSGDGSGGGVYHSGSGTLNIRNSIIAANTDNTGFAPDVDLLSDPPATTNIAFSLIGNNSGTSLVATPGLFPDANGNFIGRAAAPIDPRLAPLADNGGPTQTHALLVDSLAIGAGDPNFLPPPNLDQRGDGFVRIVEGRIDIGAFESTFETPIRAVPTERVIELEPPTREFPGDEIVGIDPRIENTTLLILIGIPVPEKFADRNGGSGGDVSAPPLGTTSSSAATVAAERTLQATLQRPHEVRREELIDAVFELGEIELVGLLGIDMGDDPVLPEKKDEKAKPEEKKEQEVLKPVVGSEGAATLPNEGRPAGVEPTASVPDSNWPPMAFWLAFAGTGTVWTSGTWWWIRRGKGKNKRG